MNYNPQGIEFKWQEAWDKNQVFKAEDLSKKPKFYLLFEFPYASGAGLHVGHCRSFIALDVVARKKRMEGFNVLFPIGWDSFGLPTENYAIKTGIHPAAATQQNTENFKKQLKFLGFSFDWSREINTSDPVYYKWTQWIFVQLFKKGLAYKAKIPINWCPSCKIGLANEEVIAGNCERCGTKVVQKEREQWMLKITKYADRLLEDLEKVDYPERVKLAQKEWIGKSEGWVIKFKIKNAKGKTDNEVEIFTTRIDTLFGVTFLVLAPEHSAIEKLKTQISNIKAVEQYIGSAQMKAAKNNQGKDARSGIELRGVTAINPANNREIPVFLADYVSSQYGTGAIMGVPCHDQRDFDFAKQKNLPFVEVIEPYQAHKTLPQKAPWIVSGGQFESAYEGEGFLINSERFDGLPSFAARVRIGEWLQKKIGKIAEKATYYKLRDWIFSRQLYWGEPIPMVYCKNCNWVPLKESDLPLELPDIKEYKPTDEGDSPLAKIKGWVNAICPKCGAVARRETDVMPNWAGSNWYYLAFAFWHKLGTQNSKRKTQKENIFEQYEKEIAYWLPVDWYNGGMEHATLHLLYSRFIYKFLWDIEAVPKLLGPEPYKKRTSHGIILGEGSVKMSKSKGNVIDPLEIAKEFGVDTLRIYQMFMGPYEQMIPWDTKSVKGARRFLEKIWNVAEKNIEHLKDKTALSIEKALHRTIKKITEDIDNLKFNTAISSLMEFCNSWKDSGSYLNKKDFGVFLKILSPFAPHISEALWEKAGFEGLCAVQLWPKYNKVLAQPESTMLILQVNGKMRDKLETVGDISEEELKEMALAREKISKWVRGQTVRRVVFVPGKLINIVV